MARAWTSGHHLPVVVMTMGVGMKGLGVLRGNMEGGLLDWVSLPSDRLWSDATSPHQGGRVRLSCLLLSRKCWCYFTESLSTTNFEMATFTQSFCFTKHKHIIFNRLNKIT